MSKRFIDVKDTWKSEPVINYDSLTRIKAASLHSSVVIVKASSSGRPLVVT
jgi:hypothetical protein